MAISMNLCPQVAVVVAGPGARFDAEAVVIARHGHGTAQRHRYSKHGRSTDPGTDTGTDTPRQNHDLFQVSLDV